jgi:hypothetical protein
VIKGGVPANLAAASFSHLLQVIRHGLKKVQCQPGLIEGCLAGTGLTLCPLRKDAGRSGAGQGLPVLVVQATARQTMAVEGQMAQMTSALWRSSTLAARARRRASVPSAWGSRRGGRVALRSSSISSRISAIRSSIASPKRDRNSSSDPMTGSSGYRVQPGRGLQAVAGVHAAAIGGRRDRRLVCGWPASDEVFPCTAQPAGSDCGRESGRDMRPVLSQTAGPTRLP